MTKYKFPPNKYEKLKNRLFNYKIFVLIFLLIIFFLYFENVINGIEFFKDWSSEQYYRINPEIFEDNANTFNILILPFDRIEKDDAENENFEMALMRRYVELNEKYKLNLRVIYDKYTLPTSDKEINEIGTNRKANLILMGDYLEKSSKARIISILFDKNLSILLTSDTTIRLYTQFNENDSTFRFSSKRKTEFFKFDDLSDICDIKKDSVLKDVDEIIYNTLFLKYYFDNDFQQAYDHTLKLKKKNDVSDLVIYYKQISCLMKLNNYHKLIETYNAFLELDPINKIAYSNKGVCFFQLSMYDSAIYNYTKAIQLDSNYKWAYFNRALLYKNLSRNAEALKDYTKIIKLDTTDANSYGDRAIIYQKMRNYYLALEDVDKFVLLDYNNSYAYMNRGICYHRLGKTNEAIIQFNKSLELDPNNTIAYHSRGNLYYDLGKFEESILDYSKAIDLDSNFILPRMGRLMCFEHTRAPDNPNNSNILKVMVKDLFFLSKSDTSSYFYWLVGKTCFLFRYLDTSIYYLNKSISIDKKQFDAYTLLGYIYFVKDDNVKAAHYYDLSFSINKSNSNIYRCRGYLFLKLNKNKEALKDFKKALSINREWKSELDPIIVWLSKSNIKKKKS